LEKKRVHEAMNCGEEFNSSETDNKATLRKGKNRRESASTVRITAQWGERTQKWKPRRQGRRPPGGASVSNDPTRGTQGLGCALLSVIILIEE